MTYKELKKTDEINTYIEQGNLVLGALGYTEHSRIHASKVASTAGKILKELGYDAHQIELAKMAGYLHDMGNSINREESRPYRRPDGLSAPAGNEDGSGGYRRHHHRHRQS